jgi:hypothetical protein
MKVTKNRIVEYVLPTGEESTIECTCPSRTLSAMVAFVHEDGTVNLSVLDTNGTWHGRSGVKFVDEGEEAPEGGNYARWPNVRREEKPKPAEANKEEVPPLDDKGEDKPATKKEPESEKKETKPHGNKHSHK